ncbi:MAG: hypothetical protein WD009_09485 [Phycisphaeraceae bacterium]
MLYDQLLTRGGDAPVRVGLIGCGTFGRGIVAQALRVDSVRLVAVADADVAGAVRTIKAAGVAEVVEASAVAAAIDAARSGCIVVTGDAMIVPELDVDVVVEATGHPAAGAAHALAAIERGRHVAMVSKETDAVVGPMLKALADDAGVVYTAVDGDQHGLIMGLVAWCRTLGLEVFCAGKALDGEWGYDAGPGDTMGASVNVWNHGQTVRLAGEDAELMRPAGYGDGARMRDRRDTLLRAGLPGIGGWDLTELTIAANANGLDFDGATSTHSPVLRVTEIAQLMCPASDGGLLTRTPAVDAVRLVRRPDEAALAGGVFAVVRGDNRVIQWATRNENMQPGEDGRTLVILRPHHFLGMEAMWSILLAGRCAIATGASDYRPRWDRVLHVRRDFEPGETIGDDHSDDLVHRVAPARAIDGEADEVALPAHLAQGCRVARRLTAGSLVTPAAVELPTAGSAAALWSLRRRQDGRFGT